MLNNIKTRNPHLSIVTWNVNSLRKRYDMVMAFIQIEKPSVLFLQETKMEDSEFDKLVFPPHYFRIHTGMKQFNGVAILSTIEPTNHITILPECPESTCRFIQMTVANLVFINVYVHQGQRIGSSYYNDKLKYLQSLINHIRALKDRSYIVIIGGDINIMPTEDDLYNPQHPEWAVMAMISVPERNLFNSILRLGFHDIVAERLQHRPYTRWAHYNSAKDKQQGFRLDYFFTPILEAKHITAVQVLTHWRAMPDASDHAPVRMLLTTQL
jgi:exodeoxyribonuclease-3